MIIMANNKMSGHELIQEEIRKGRINNIKKEIIDLRRDFKNADRGIVQLKNIDRKWINLTRLERINKGKRFKEYVKRGYIM